MDINLAIRLVTEHRAGLVEVFLKSGEDVSDLFGSAQVGHGVGDGVVVLELQQRSQLLLIEFLNTHLDVLGEHEIEENLLFGIEAAGDL